MILNTTTEQGLAPDVIDEVDENTTYLGFFQPGTSNCLIKRILKVDTITTIQYPNGQYDFIHDWDQRTVYNYSFRK